MKYKFYDILKMLQLTKRENENYYNLNEFIQIFNLNKYNIEMDNILFVPFYITDKYCEIYDYEFDLEIVDNPDPKKYILEKFHKDRIEDLDEEYVDKLSNCNIQITKKQYNLFVIAINNYYNLLVQSKGFRDRIPKIMGEFKPENIYFASYWEEIKETYEKENNENNN